MTDIMLVLLSIIGIMFDWIKIIMVPPSMSSITIVHAAIWTPVTIGLVKTTGALINRMRPKQVFSTSVGVKRADSETLAFLASNPGTIQRHIRQNTSMGVGDVEAAVRRLKHKGLIRRRWFSAKFDLTTEGKKAADKAQRDMEAEERAEAAAQRAAAQAVAAQERAQQVEEAKAQKAAQLATERAQKAQERAQQAEEAKAQKAAQLATERAQKAQERAQQAEEAKAQKAAQLATERAQKAQERAQQAEEAKAQKAAKAVVAARRAIERAQKAPRTRTPRRRANTDAPARLAPRRDSTTRAFGADPSRVYEFRYRVVALDALVTSNLDSGSVNPAYDPTLQPRQRQRSASQRQIEQAAAHLVPEALLWDFRSLDKGAPIVGDDLQVESGNGRALALRRARLAHPEQWEKYQAALRENLAAVGLSDDEIAGVDAPVLVRERVTQVADRAAFAREANAPPVLQMSTLETAMVDATRISGVLVGNLAVREGQSIDLALRAKANEEFVRGFIGTLSENEAALLQRKDGTLAQAGIRRIKAALFVRTFEGEAGERLAETFLEALDSDIKNFENGLTASLPVLARAEHLISKNERAVESMTDDISRAIDMLARLKEQDMTVQNYLDATPIWGRETTSFQDDLLAYFHIVGRSSKKIREFFEGYAAEVEKAPSPDQLDLFGNPVVVTKQEVFARLTKGSMAMAA